MVSVVVVPVWCVVLSVGRFRVNLVINILVRVLLVLPSLIVLIPNFGIRRCLLSRST